MGTPGSRSMELSQVISELEDAMVGCFFEDQEMKFDLRNTQ